MNEGETVKPYRIMKPELIYKPISDTLTPASIETLKSNDYQEISIDNKTAFAYMPAHKGDFFTRAVDEYQRKVKVNSGHRFHFTYCEKLKEYADKDDIHRLFCTTRKDGEFTIWESRKQSKKEKVKLIPCRKCVEHFYHTKDKATIDTIIDNFSCESFSREFSSLNFHVWNTVIDPDSPGEDFDKISKRLREEKNYACEQCQFQAYNTTTRYFIHAHHINKNSEYDDIKNLQVLCYFCHANQPKHEQMKTGENQKQYNVFKRIREDFFRDK